MLSVTWSELKRVCVNTQSPIQWIQLYPNEYTVFLIIGPVCLSTVLLEGSEEYTEFETSYKTTTLSKYASSVAALPTPDGFFFAAQAASWTTAVADTTTSIFFTPSTAEDRWIDGGVLVTPDPVLGSFVKFEVCTPSNVVIAEYIGKWYLEGTRTELRAYPAKIPAGFKIKISLTNISSSTSFDFGCNLRLHRRS